MTDRELISSLLALCERFGTNQREFEKSHLAMAEPNEHLGVCNTRRAYDPNGGRTVKDGTGFRVVDQPLSGTCADACVLWRQTVTAARQWLAEREPRQLELVS